MKLAGFQKLTLLDYPGKVACTLFTPGCNFRCPFCHNASLVTHVDPAAELPVDEVLSFLKKRQGLLEGVCITGGEPLLQPGIEDLMAEIHALGFQMKLDTNGSFPDRLEIILKNQLVDYVAMDIKSSPEGYDLLTGISVDINAIRHSVSLLISGNTDYEFRTTAVKGLHTREDFLSIGPMIRGAKAYYIQSYVDSGDVIVPRFQAFDKDTLSEYLSLVKPYVGLASLRGV